MTQPFSSVWNKILTLVRSIRFRLALWFVFSLGVVMVAFSGFIYSRVVRDIEGFSLRRLEFQSRRIEALLRGPFFESEAIETGARADFLAPAPPIAGEFFLQEGDVIAVISSGGEVVQMMGAVAANPDGESGTAGAVAVIPDGERGTAASIPAEDQVQVVKQLAQAALEQGGPPKPGPGSTVFVTLAARETASLTEPARYIARLVPLGGESQNGYVLVAGLFDPNNQLIRLKITLGLGILLTLALAFAGGFWLADRAMRPVKQITRAARTIGGSDLGLRLNLPGRDELAELARTFDGMLDRLQAAFNQQRQFTADASHELRTPLTIMELETSRVLAHPRTSEEYEQALQVIAAENTLMIRLVNNLLTLARMDAGQVVLQAEPLDLSDIALEVVERLEPLAEKDQIHLEAGDLPELLVLGDRQYLGQMLTNLVENAIKYAPPGNGQVLVTAGLRSEAGQSSGWVRVSDNGAGIPPEHLPRLFDRFYRVDQARSRADSLDGEAASSAQVGTSGTGLGLSIARWIAHAHGGEITVQNAPSGGAVFEFSMALSKPNQEINLDAGESQSSASAYPGFKEGEIT